jgi:hypothetical protein
LPRIFDNIDQQLLPALQLAMQNSKRGDFCVGYLNLRGWRQLDEQIECWSGQDGCCCRLLVGMQRLPEQELHDAYQLLQTDPDLDNQTAIRLKKRLAQEFRSQLTIGAPTDADEAGLRRLIPQIREGKLVVKLFLRHTLHAKLYLCHRTDPINPRRRFSRQQQPDLRRTLQTGRTQRRCDGPRLLPEARQMVRRTLARQMVLGYFQGNRGNHPAKLGA